MKTRNRRRLFPIVDRRMQYRFLATILSYGLIMVVLIGAVVFVPDAIVLNNEKLSPEMRGMVADRILTLHARIWPSIIAMVCIFAIHSFRVFLKVVGPLYRFRWAFAKISKGEMDFRVRLRRKDYLLREANMFNEMINVLTDKLGSMQSLGQNAIKSLETMEQSVSELSGEQKKYQQLLKTHRQHLENLVDQARYFKLMAEGKTD